MSSLIVHDTVKILVTTILPQDRANLASYLGIPPYKVCHWDDMYRNGTLTQEEFFTKILQNWVSRNGDTATVAALVTILIENEFKAAADSLGCPSSKITNFSFGVKKPLINFVGRVSEVEELTKWLQNDTSKAFLISGIGGQGKTELSRRFIQQLTPGSTVVTWFRGDDATQLQNSLNDCASSMNLPTKDYNGRPISIKNLVKNIGNSVSKITGPDCRWLAVIDNVDEEYEEFQPAVQESLENDAYVLVTSRRNNILSADSGFKNLKELKEDDSIAFVNKVLEKTESKDVTDLCQALQNHALALQQAVAYIKFKQRELDSAYGIPEYLELFNQDIDEPHDHQLGLSGYDRTMSKIIDMTLNKLFEIDINTETQSILLLHIISLLNPDRIPMNFLQNLFALFEPETKFKNSKKTLKMLCMIRVENGMVSIHRVVQKLVRNMLRIRSTHQEILSKIFKDLDVDILSREEISHLIRLSENASLEPELLTPKNLVFNISIISRLFTFLYPVIYKTTCKM